MDAMEALMTRRSIRSFQAGEVVAEDDLMAILDAGRMAPSAGNLQPLFFIVVKNSEQKARVRAAAFDQEIISLASLVVAVCVDPERSAKYGDKGRNYFSSLDAANATENILLAAHALGYGACWVGGFDPKAMREVLGLPEDFRVVSLIPIGKAAAQPETPDRRTLKDMLRFDRWS